MLLHLRPKIYSADILVDLLELSIDRFGVQLLRERDLMIGRPYPNKNYVVGCRKQGRKAIDGILLKVDGPVDKFCLTARWQASGIIATHRVHYTILDCDFGAASDKMMLWHKTRSGLPSRIPVYYRGCPPIYTEPVMHLEGPASARRLTMDVVDIGTGWIADRTQSFAMPSIEPERLLDRESNPRLPAPEDAFEVRVSRRPFLVPASMRKLDCSSRDLC
jgi:hypothetical protein